MASSDSQHLVDDVLRTLGDEFDESGVADELERLSGAAASAEVVRAHLGLASRLALLRGSLAEAELATARAVEVAAQVAEPDVVAEAASARARHRSAIGDHFGGLDALTVAFQPAVDARLPPKLAAQLREVRAELLFRLQLYADVASSLDEASARAPLSARAAVLQAASMVLTRPDAAQSLLAEAVANAKELKDAAVVAEALYWEGVAAALRGDFATAESCVEAIRGLDPQRQLDRIVMLFADMLEAIVIARTSEEISAIAKLISVRHRSRSLWPRLDGLQEAFRLCITERSGDLARREYINQFESDLETNRDLQLAALISSRAPTRATMPSLVTQDVLLSDKLERAVAKSLRALWESAVDAELRLDPSGEHPLRVGRLARLFAHSLGKGEGFCRDIEKAAAWHDIGMVSVPDRIVCKPSRLTADEMRELRGHCAIGAQLLSEQLVEHSAIRMGVLVARSHHERYDGSGYPQALVGQAIPEAARIASLCDAFDALTHGRPWRGPLGVEAALQLMSGCRGSQFDPDLTDRFVECVRGLHTSHGHRLDGYLVAGAPSLATLELRKALVQRPVAGSNG